MRCPICREILSNGDYDVIYSCKVCEGSDIYLLSSGEIDDYYFYFNKLYSINIKSLSISGSKQFNTTKLYDEFWSKILVETSFISLNPHNLPEDVPKLINKLMKLKAFT